MGQIKYTIVFDSAWILNRRRDTVLPVENLLSELRRTDLSYKIIHSAPMRCEMVVMKEQAQALKEEITRILSERYGLQLGGDVVEMIEDTYEEDTILEVDTEPSVEKKPVIESIRSLVGAAEFKVLAEECVKVAPLLRKSGTEDTFTHRSYIFSINNGGGLSTYLNLFADLLQEQGLVEFPADCSVEEIALPSLTSRAGKETPFEIVYTRLRATRVKRNRILCIDISEWMARINEKPFRDFLFKLEDYAGKMIFIFRVPFVEKEVLAGLEAVIGDVLLLRTLSFVPFDAEELKECAAIELKERGFAVEQDVWEVFHTKVAEEKNDGRFYGINTVNKIIKEMLYCKQLANALAGVEDRVIKRQEILPILHSVTDQQNGMEVLSNMVGMEPVRQRVEEIVIQIETAMKNENLGSPCIHMRFVGNPGTGKTTVARIIGQILKEKGVLRNGNFFEHAGRDFCGRYIGETAPKTAAMCRDAYGSVLFIDEAYSLYRQDGSRADFGREALDTLIAEMENHRRDLVVIMAGYPEEMDELMQGNAGLASRMPYIIEFPNYTREQLADIFMSMANKNFACQSGLEQAVRDYFAALSDEVYKAREFSNARYVRNLFERTWGKAAMRTQLQKSGEIILTAEDFAAAGSEREFAKTLDKPRRHMGF